MNKKELEQYAQNNVESMQQAIQQVHSHLNNELQHEQINHFQNNQGPNIVPQTNGLQNEHLLSTVNLGEYVPSNLTLGILRNNPPLGLIPPGSVHIPVDQNLMRSDGQIHMVGNMMNELNQVQDMNISGLSNQMEHHNQMLSQGMNQMRHLNRPLIVDKQKKIEKRNREEELEDLKNLNLIKRLVYPKTLQLPSTVNQSYVLPPISIPNTDTKFPINTTNKSQEETQNNYFVMDQSSINMMNPIEMNTTEHKTTKTYGGVLGKKKKTIKEKEQEENILEMNQEASYVQNPSHLGDQMINSEMGMVMDNSFTRENPEMHEEKVSKKKPRIKDDEQPACCVKGCVNPVSNRLRFSLRCMTVGDFKQDYIRNNLDRVCNYHYFNDLYKHKKKKKDEESKISKMMNSGIVNSLNINKKPN